MVDTPIGSGNSGGGKGGKGGRKGGGKGGEWHPKRWIYTASPLNCESSAVTRDHGAFESHIYVSRILQLNSQIITRCQELVSIKRWLNPRLSRSDSWYYHPITNFLRFSGRGKSYQQQTRTICRSVKVSRSWTRRRLRKTHRSGWGQG
jgi:hypothetical protein